MNDQLRETLIILQEECVEVAQVISKIMRFGPDQIIPGKDETNLQHLEKEIGDVEAMIELLQDFDIGVSKEGCTEAKQKKFEKLKQWSNLTFTK